MNRITTYLNSLGRSTRVLVLALAVVVAGAGIAQAATTISTNITTAGTLSVTGLSSLGQASSTMLSANTAYFGATATSTFGSAGQLTLLGALSGTSGTFSSTLGATGDTTLASTTATTMKVGQVGTGMTRIVSGYCVTGSITIPSTGATQTQTYANCSPFTAAGTAITLTSSDRVFVQATSSLPFYVFVQSASSTANAINLGLTNISTTTSPSAAVYAFNFWSFQ